MVRNGLFELLKRGFMFLLFFLIANITTAQVELKTRKERDTSKVVKQVIRMKQSKSKEVRKEDDFSKLDQFLKIAEKSPAIWDLSRAFTVKSTTTLKGRLLNSVMSTNLESPMVVELVDSRSSLPVGTIFSCRGSTKHKRVFSACDRIILPEANGEEYPVRVSVLNTDGSAGIKADYYYSGKEEIIAGVVASAAIRGVVESSQERIATPLGQVTPDTVKNRYLNGLLGSTDEMTSMMREDMRTKEPKATIEAGKEVLIYFNERLEI